MRAIPKVVTFPKQKDLCILNKNFRNDTLNPVLHTNDILNPVSDESFDPLTRYQTRAHDLELDRYIGNTHHRGRLWDNRNHRNHRQMMTIGDQSVPMFHDDVTH